MYLKKKRLLHTVMLLCSWYSLRRYCNYILLTGSGILERSFPIQFFTNPQSDNRTLGLGVTEVRRFCIVGETLSISPGTARVNV